MEKIKQKGGRGLRIVSVLLTIMLILSLTACKSKDPITADAFKETVEGLEYMVTDVTGEYPNRPQILNVLSCEGDSVYMEFLEIDTADNATATFNGDKAWIEEQKEDSSSESSVSMGSYQKYTLKTSEKYYLVEQVSTTLIFAFSDKSESGKLDDIIKELGY